MITYHWSPVFPTTNCWPLLFPMTNYWSPLFPSTNPWSSFTQQLITDHSFSKWLITEQHKFPCDAICWLIATFWACIAHFLGKKLAALVLPHHMKANNLEVKVFLLRHVMLPGKHMSALLLPGFWLVISRPQAV